MVNEIVDEIIPTSTTNIIIDILINRSVSEGRKELVWREIVDNDDMKTEILRKNGWNPGGSQDEEAGKEGGQD